MIALPFLGSAILLMSCEGNAGKAEIDDTKIVSRTVRDMETVASENGLKKQLIRAPLREEYAYAKTPYDEYTRGVEVIGYDSLGRPSSSVVGDYALYWRERDLYELKGNVIVEGEGGERLYTQQLNWDVKLKKIYSHVDFKIEQGNNVTYGVGFEAADDFSWWRFQEGTGTMMVSTEPTEPTADSTSVAPEPVGAPAADSLKTAP
jgi:LPS export ABC transporter protein LptC